MSAHRCPLPARRLLRAVAAGALVGAALTACSRGEIAVAPAPMAADPACARVVEGLPEDLAGVIRQPIPAEAEGSAAAWGNPAIVARCGVNPPPPSTDACLAVDDVDWVVQELSDGAAFTTYGRSPALEVLVPATYGQGASVVAQLGDVARELPSTGRSCS